MAIEEMKQKIMDDYGLEEKQVRVKRMAKWRIDLHDLHEVCWVRIWRGSFADCYKIIPCGSVSTEETGALIALIEIAVKIIGSGVLDD